MVKLQDLEAANATLGEAVDVARRQLGPDHPAALRARVQLANVHRLRGRTEVLGDELDRLLPALRRRREAMPEDLNQALRYAAILARTVGREDEAAVLAEEAMALASVRWGERSPLTAESAVTLARTYAAANRPGPALAAAEQALRLTLQVSGGNARHPHVIQARLAHVAALSINGEQERALAECEVLVRDAQEVFSPESTVVAYALPYLTLLRLELGEIEKALESGAQAVEVGAHKVEPGSLAHAIFLDVRARSLLAARRAEDALRDLEQVAETFERVRGASHASTLEARRRRALALAYLGRAGEAWEALRPTRAWDDRGAGTAMGTALQGTVARLAGDAAGALRLHRGALASLRAGPDAERSRMRIRAEMGLDWVELRRHDAAAAALEESLGLYRRLQRALSAEGADVLLGLGRARMGQGRPSEALAVLEEADAFWRALDPAGRWAGEAAFWLGRCQEELGRTHEARRALARAREILARSPLPTDAALVRLARR
jgi:tetratricopeptide (TPR) repeat protein